MDTLSPEIIELIIAATLDRNHKQNLSNLLKLQKICTSFILPARRLIFRDIIIESVSSAINLQENLVKFGHHVKYLKFEQSAFSVEEGEVEPPPTFLVDTIKLCPNLISFISPYAPAELNRNSRAKSHYPSTLQNFRVAASQVSESSPPYMDSDSDLDSDEEIASDDEGEEVKKVLKRVALREAGFVPEILRKLYDVPTTLASLEILHARRLIGNPAGYDEQTPTRLFPCTNLRSLEISYSRITEEVFKWMLQPSIAMNGTYLKRLKLWGVSLDETTVILPILETLGPRLEEFVYKSATASYPRTFANKAVQLLPSLKALTFGSRTADKSVYNDIVSNTITKLCIALPDGIPVSLSDFIIRLTSGNLKNVRRFELYANKYFPPPVEVEVLDDSDTIPSSQLREVRFAHLEANGNHLNRFFTIFGSGLKILALHHINEDFSRIIPHCTNIFRLELGVNDCVIQESNDFPLDLPLLHSLRLHFHCGITLRQLIKAIQNDESLPSLTTLDLVGPITHAPRNFTGKRIGELVELCRIKGIDFCLNGKNVNSIADLWTALVEFERSN